MRVVATVQPGLGHLLPVVPLLAALRRAGHEVLLACSPTLLPLAARLGLPARAVGPRWSWAQPEQLLGRARPQGAEQERAVLSDAMDLARFALLPALRELLADGRTDLVVHEQYEPSGPLAAELTGTACLCVGHGYSPYLTAPYLGGSAVPARRPLAVRVALGLPPRPRPDWLYAYADSFPPSLQPFPPQPQPQPQPLRWLLCPALPPQDAGTAVAGGPTDDGALVTFGTVAGARAAQLPLVVEAVRAAGARPLLLDPPPGADPAATFTPLGALLGGCRLAVTHGGSGTTVAALAAGLPVLVLPGQDEQRYLGFRVAGAGAGLVLTEGEATPHRVRTAVRALLEEPGYRYNAGRLAAEIAAMPGPEVSVERLDALLGVVPGPGRAAGPPPEGTRRASAG